MPDVNLTNFVKYRKKMGLSKKRASEKAGLSRGMASKIEREKTASDDTLAKFGKLFGCDPNELHEVKAKESLVKLRRSWPEREEKTPIAWTEAGMIYIDIQAVAMILVELVKKING